MLTWRIALAGLLAFLALFLAPILVVSPLMDAALLLIAIVLITTGWRRLAKRK